MGVPEEVLRGRDEIGAALRETIARRIVSHTVIVCRTPVGEAEPLDHGMKYMVGSGTLVQVDVGAAQPRYGLLTCGHVLGAFDQAMPGARNGSMVLIAMNNKPKGTGRPWANEIGYGEDDIVIEGARNRGSRGPDLAWLHLTPEQAHGLQDGADSGAVFYNFTKGLFALEAFQRGPNGKGPPSKEEFAGNNMVMAVGWNRQIQERRGGRPYFFGLSEVMSGRQSAIDGWHYADFGINDDRMKSAVFEDGTKLPSTWGGLSGGAVWQIWRPDRSRDMYVKILGIIYQSHIFC